MANSYGEEYVADCRDLLVVRLDALIAELTSSGITPCPVAAHSKHLVARMNLPAVTVGFIGESDLKLTVRGSSLPGGNKYTGVDHDLLFSIRVHTDFVGGRQDELVQSQLLTSIANYLLQKMDLDTAYRIMRISDVRAGRSFDDSATLGAEMTVQVNVMLAHTQESA